MGVHVCRQGVDAERRCVVSPAEVVSLEQEEPAVSTRIYREASCPGSIKWSEESASRNWERRTSPSGGGNNCPKTARFGQC